MLTDISSTLAPGLSCPESFIAVQAFLTSISAQQTFCCPSHLDALPTPLSTIPASCVSLISKPANHPAAIPIPTTLQTVPVTAYRAELKPRATTSSAKTTATSSHSITSSTTSSLSSTKASSSTTSSSTSATSTSKPAHSKIHFSTAVKIVVVIVIVLFVLTLLLVAFCCYKRISKKRKLRKGKAPVGINNDAFVSKGSGLGINAGAYGGGNAYGLGGNAGPALGSGLVGGPNGRMRDGGAGFEGFRGKEEKGKEAAQGYEAYRGEARASFQLEQERIKAGLVPGKA